MSFVFLARGPESVGCPDNLLVNYSSVTGYRHENRCYIDSSEVPCDSRITDKGTKSAFLSYSCAKRDLHRYFWHIEEDVFCRDWGELFRMYDGVESPIVADTFTPGPTWPHLGTCTYQSARCLVHVAMKWPVVRVDGRTACHFAHELKGAKGHIEATTGAIVSRSNVTITNLPNSYNLGSWGRFVVRDVSKLPMSAREQVKGSGMIHHPVKCQPQASVSEGQLTFLPHSNDKHTTSSSLSPPPPPP